MKIVEPEQVEKLTNTYEEGLLDCVGALDDVLVDYVEATFPNDDNPYDYDLDDVCACEEFLSDKYGDFYASSDPINWQGYADIFNFNETANNGFWAHWNSLFECTTCGKTSEDTMPLYECRSPECINSMCEDCVTIWPQMREIDGEVKFNRMVAVCKECKPGAKPPTEFDDWDGDY